MLGEYQKYHICPVCKRSIPTRRRKTDRLRVFKSHMPHERMTTGTFCPGSGLVVRS